MKNKIIKTTAAEVIIRITDRLYIVFIQLMILEDRDEVIIIKLQNSEDAHLIKSIYLIRYMCLF